jgi:hypothetical protein
MLKAKFLKMAKGGTLAIYEVQGTSTELDNFVKSNYKDREPAFKTDSNRVPIEVNGNKVPLYFTSYPMPGKNIWHPMYQVQDGANAGSWTLDKSELQFEMLVSKSTGGDLGQSIATAFAAKYVDASSTTLSSAANLLLDDSEDESTESDSDVPEETSEEADLSAIAPKPATKTTK